MSHIQPYFVFATNEYHKSVVMKNGIVHVYHFLNNCDELGKVSAIPDGCVDIFFEKNNDGICAQACGTVLEKTELDNQMDHEYFGIRFMPGVLPLNLDVSMQELVQHQINLKDVIHQKDIVNKIADTEDWQTCIKLFIENIFAYQAKTLPKMHDEKKHLADNIRDMIVLHKGNMQIKTLAEYTGYSVRYIDKIFKEFIGVSPKTFAKIVQLQNTIQSINSTQDNYLTNVGFDSGYFDQSHFIRDFKKSISMTPTEYKNLIKNNAYVNRINVNKLNFL